MPPLQHSVIVHPGILAPGHPYLANGSACTVRFNEYRGTGPPTSDFGNAGDVYVDLNPRLYALYWRARSIAGNGPWMRWTHILLDQTPLYQYLAPHPWVRHPETSDLFLWVDPGGVTWAAKDAICASRAKMVNRGIAAVAPGTIPDVQGLVSEVLQHMLAAEKTRHSRSSGVFGPDDRKLPLPQASLSWNHGAVVNVKPPASRRSSISVTSPPPMASNNRRSSVTLPFRPSGGGGGQRSPSVQRSTTPTPQGMPGYTRYAEGYALTSSINPYSVPSTTPTESMQTLEEVRRAQGAELKSKQELKLKNRELSKLRQKEKDVISMSYHYQKRERELVAALAAAEQRSSAELEELRGYAGEITTASRVGTN
ncbi:hypothetical protein MKEN_00408400 [Mycena kentingensis (nom. inval.)]|nr:hypothetical protein MKEN_00408400 [Mycena kentingensis (nom. inval.)]